MKCLPTKGDAKGLEETAGRDVHHSEITTQLSFAYTNSFNPLLRSPIFWKYLPTGAVDVIRFVEHIDLLSSLSPGIAVQLWVPRNRKWIMYMMTTSESFSAGRSVSYPRNLLTASLRLAPTAKRTFGSRSQSSSFRTFWDTSCLRSSRASRRDISCP